jgi:ribosomal protein S18 acetylase RimI-like enzyme
MKAPAGIWLRRTEAADREPILGFIRQTELFRAGELSIAAELLDSAIAAGPAGHYQSFTAEVAGTPAGWTCLGPTPCTEGTFDLYWIVVAPACQRSGVGSALLRHAENLAAERGGRLMVVETSGRAAYAPSRRFYLRHGYREAARVPAFYAPTDDKLILLKPLQA